MRRVFLHLTIFILVVKFFGEEDAQCFFINCFAEAVADEEAQQGNELCSKVIQTFYEELAFGVFNVQHMLDPEMILFGGAISARRDFTQRIMEAYEKLHKGLDFATLTPRLECCTYRQDANLLGALAHYRQRKGLAE